MNVLEHSYWLKLNIQRMYNLARAIDAGRAGSIDRTSVTELN